MDAVTMASLGKIGGAMWNAREMILLPLLMIVVMSLTGIFLMLFLVVHLLGNLQLLKDDGGEAFNTYAFFMTHNPLIKFISYSLYAFILWHAVQGIRLWQNNKAARGNDRYAVTYSRPEERSSRNMAAA